MKNGVDVELVIFDLDGTLVDSRADIANALNHTLRRLGLKPVTLEEVERRIGRGVRGLLRESLGERQDLMEMAYPTFLDFYSSHLLDNTRPYPGIKDLLRSLEDKKKAIVTNKLLHLTRKVLKGLGLDGYFQTILGGDSLPERKPSPLPIQRIMEEAGASREKTIMVGDSPLDIEAGKKAGVITCGAAYGYNREDDLLLAGADYVVGDVAELKILLTTHSS